LLLSTSSRFPDGLANSSGLVGRRLMMHPYGQVVGIFEEELDSWWGPWGQRVYSLEFYETDARRGFVRGAKWAAMPTGGPMIAMAECGVNVGDDVWGENLHKHMRKWFGHSVFWGIIAEDLPEESNRVTLDAELTDSDGIPAPKIQYRISENSHRILDFHLARAREAMEAAGALETVSSLVADTGWHLLGTARMGTDPRTSVVDAWGRAHDVPNLCLIDGSIFTTGAGLNPTATICALALRNVEKIIADRRNMKTA
jgi:choline dehydrogenase-like flavoprotein